MYSSSPHSGARDALRRGQIRDGALDSSRPAAPAAARRPAPRHRRQQPLRRPVLAALHRRRGASRPESLRLCGRHLQLADEMLRARGTRRPPRGRLRSHVELKTGGSITPARIELHSRDDRRTIWPRATKRTHRAASRSGVAAVRRESAGVHHCTIARTYCSMGKFVGHGRRTRALMFYSLLLDCLNFKKLKF